MGALTVMTLGAPRILHAGVVRTFSIRKSLALTLYLAVTGQAHPRARLIALFWPDADEAHGLLNLRQTLLRIRQALGDDAENHLRTVGDLVRLDPGDDGLVDVTVLAAAITPQATTEQRLAALQSYEDEFLARLMIEDAPDFMDWVAAQRAYWGECYDLVAERQIQWLLDSGDASEASRLGQTWVMQRPDCEPAYRLLATAQAAMGDLTGARLTLANATHHWAALDLDTPSEIQALQAQLAALPTTTPPIGTTDVAESARILHLPFTGRQQEFIQLRQAYQRAQTGIPGVALVQGEAGLGKSRLVEAFLRWAEAQGADIAVGNAYEQSERLPYRPLMELLRRRLAREHAPDDLLDDSWLIELQRLVPDLHDRYPDLPLPVDDAAAGTRLIEAIAQLGIALARRQPLLWLLEDLHWADVATRDGLLYLLKRWQDEDVRCLVVCTLRSEEVTASPEIEEWLAALERTTATTITLTPFSVELTSRVAHEVLAETASPELCAWLYDETQGNPLYLEHVLQALIERGALQWQGNVLRLVADLDVEALTTWLPETLRGLLLRRVRRLDAAAQQTLAAAAVIGTQFGEELLMQVAGVDEDTLLAALDTAEHRLLIQADGERYRFAHAKVAEVVYSDLTPARRRVFHRRTLETLETRGGALPATMARHAIAAAMWEQADRYSVQAAKAAEQIGAHRDALHWYQQCVHMLTTPPSREVLWHLLTEATISGHIESLGMQYAIMGEKQHARDLYQQMFAESRLQGKRLLEERTLRMLGRHTLTFEQDNETAQQILEESRKIAEELGDISGLLMSETLLTVVALEREDLPLAQYYGQHAVQLARKNDQPLRLAQGLLQLGGVFRQRGQWEESARSVEEALVIFADQAIEGQTLVEHPPYRFTPVVSWEVFFPQIAPLLRQQPSEANNTARQWGANGLMAMGMSRVHVGDGEIGRAALEMGWRIFGERKAHRFFYHYLLHKTIGWLEAGDYELAFQNAQQILEEMATATERPIDPTNVMPVCALVDIYHALFQLTNAHVPLNQALAFASKPGKLPAERILPLARISRHHALAGDWAAAYTAAQEAQEVRNSMPSQLVWFDLTRYYETEALLRAGDHTRARADAERLGAQVGANRRYRLVYLRMLALVERDAGNHSAAIEHLTEALNLAMTMGLPGEEWQTSAELATSYMQNNDMPHAQEAHARATAGIATLAARITDAPLRNHFGNAALSRLPTVDLSSLPDNAAPPESAPR